LDRGPLFIPRDRDYSHPPRAGPRRNSVPSGEETTIPPRPRSYSSDWTRPTSFGIWGSSAGDRARLAWSIAHRIDPNPFWLQIETPTGTHDPIELAILDRVPADHLFFLDPSELAPQTDLGNMASYFVREEITAEDRLRAVADFMRLPALAQQILEGRSPHSPTKVLAFANSDRAAALYSSREGGIVPLIEAINECAATIIFIVSTTPQPQNAQVVDYLLRLKDDDPGGISVVKAECPQGAPPGVPGLFTTGDRLPLTAMIDQIERTLT